MTKTEDYFSVLTLIPVHSAPKTEEKHDLISQQDSHSNSIKKWEAVIPYNLSTNCSMCISQKHHTRLSTKLYIVLICQHVSISQNPVTASVSTFKTGYLCILVSESWLCNVLKIALGYYPFGCQGPAFSFNELIIGFVGRYWKTDTVGYINSDGSRISPRWGR